MKTFLFPLSFRPSNLLPVASWRGLLASALLLTPAVLGLSSARAEHSLTGPRREVAIPEAVGAPSNDNFSNPLLFTGATGTMSGTNVGATKQTGEPDPADIFGGSSVWYSWTPTVTALALFSTGGSDFDTILGVYTGTSVSSLTEVASNDDYGSLNSQVTFVARAGTTYHIVVDGFGGDTGNIIVGFNTNPNTTVPLITSATSVTVTVNTAFSYHLTATNNPTSFTATGLPTGLTLNTRTGLISGTPTVRGKTNAIVGATNANGSSQVGLSITVVDPPTHPPFFSGEVSLGNGAYYLMLSSGNPFGYYSYLTDPNYIYHFDMGYEYLFDADDFNYGIYLYDFKSRGFFYTSPYFPFPYLYDFALRSTVYYYPDPNNVGHYNTNGIRYFYVFSTGQTISK